MCIRDRYTLGKGDKAADLLLQAQRFGCLLYTSDAVDDTPCVDLGGRRIIKKHI
ncbi:hypothetical protein JMUB7516_27530 [Staphylococcus aureus]